MNDYSAHSANSAGFWEPLPVHLKKTATLAKQFASAFGEASAGEWLGWFHDAGKASTLFQDVLKGLEHNVNHAAAGAYLLKGYHMLSRVIYAHHDGLHWFMDLELSMKEQGSHDT